MPIRKTNNLNTDLTSANKPQNPSKIIHDNYKMLMDIQDPDQLKNTIIELIKPLRGHGFSDKNYLAFAKSLQQASMRGLDGIQLFLTNFMLKGSNLGVIESKIDAIAGFVSEDASKSVQLTSKQLRLKSLVESYGFAVALISENEINRGFDIASYVFHDHDGPVTNWVALVRTLELVSQHKMSPDSAANFMHKSGIIDPKYYD